jgi:hypothetical protein
MAEPPVTDEGAGDTRESEEMLGLALTMTVETAAAGEPGHGAFDRPTVTSQPLGGLNSLAGDTVPDASAA